MQVELDRLNGEIEQKQEKIAHIEHSIRLDRLEKEVVELEYISSLVDRFNKVKGEEQKLKILFEITARYRWSYATDSGVQLRTDVKNC